MQPAPPDGNLEPTADDRSPSAAQLEAQLARERQEQAALAAPPLDVAAIEEGVSAIAETLDELEQLAGPPPEERTLELMEKIEWLAAEAEGELHDSVMAQAQRLAELAGREQPKTAEQLEAEAQEAELEKAQKTYFKKVRSVLGDELPLEPCEACSGRGLVIAGAEAPPEFRPHAQFRRCEACDGFGHVLTGSRLEGSDVQACPDCGGRGYLERQQTAEQVAAAIGNGELETTYGKPSWLGDPNLAPARA